MANKYFRTVGGNITLSTNWSTTDGGIADTTTPTAADACFFTVNSGNCTVNANINMFSLDFTGYSGTLSGGSAAILITVTSATTSYITLSPTMTITTTCSLVANAITVNLTSNGKTWTGTLTATGGTKTYTFVDNWTVQHFSTTGGTGTLIGGTVTVLGNFTSGGGTSSTSTLSILMTGTGTISGVGGNGTPITIDTLGTITFSGVIIMARLLTYIKGTVITTGSTLKLYTLGGISGVVDSKNIVWNIIQIGSGTNTASGTFLSGFTCSTLLFGDTSSTAVAFLILTPGFTHRVTGSIGMGTAGSDGNNPTVRSIKSTVPGTQAILTVDAAATCNLGFMTVTDINASGGRAINVFGGTVSNCINVNPYTTPIITSAKSFVS